MIRVHIKELQKMNKKTHNEVAISIGVARSTYTNIINGHKMPSYKVATKLANYFKVPLDSIIFGPIVTISNQVSEATLLEKNKEAV